MKRLVIVVLATACCGCDDWVSVTATDRVGELAAAQHRELVELNARIDTIGRTMLSMPPENQDKEKLDAYFREMAEKVIKDNQGLPRICKVFVAVPGMERFHAYWTYTITNELTQVTTERK